MNHPFTSKQFSQLPAVYPQFDDHAMLNDHEVMILHKWVYADGPMYAVQIITTGDEYQVPEVALSPIPNFTCTGCGHHFEHIEELSGETGDCWQCTFKAAGYPLTHWQSKVRYTFEKYAVTMRFFQRDENGRILGETDLYIESGGPTQRIALGHAHEEAYNALMDLVNRGILL